MYLIKVPLLVLVLTVFPKISKSNPTPTSAPELTTTTPAPKSASTTPAKPAHNNTTYNANNNTTPTTSKPSKAPTASLTSNESSRKVIDRVLRNAPIIDGHNDLPLNLKDLVANDLRKVDLNSDLTKHPIWYKVSNFTHTDIPRMRAGGIGGQFWSAWVDCSAQFKDAVEQTLERIDTIKRMVQKYPTVFTFALSSGDIEAALKKGKIASLIGVEGGHLIHSNYGILRSYYELGARYLTLTHTCNTPWADSSRTDEPNPLSADYAMKEHFGLTNWGMGVIDEMNRLGMIVDLSHTSETVMRQALKRSKAPIMFSHSASKFVFNHHRNVPNDVLQLVKTTDSIVMLNLYSKFLVADPNEATIAHAVAHANHIKKEAGVEHIGIGGDYDGADMFPKGLEHVGKLRGFLEALYETGNWTEADLEKLTSRNIRRVFAKVEQVRDFLKLQEPKEEPLAIPQSWMPHPALTQKFF